MLLINCSNREQNCYKVLEDLKKEDDTLLSLSHKNMSFCLGCECCQKDLPKHCVLDDYITNNVYSEVLRADEIVLASPMYMSNINGILKNLLDRFNALYNHQLLKNKKIYLIMSGYATKEENEEEIRLITEYFKGITEYMYFDFEFLGYLVDSEDNEEEIKSIREKLGR